MVDLEASKLEFCGRVPSEDTEPEVSSARERVSTSNFISFILD